MAEPGWHKYRQALKDLHPELNLTDTDIEFFFLLTIDRDGLYLQNFMDKLGRSNTFCRRVLKRLEGFKLVEYIGYKVRLSKTGYEAYKQIY